MGHQVVPVLSAASATASGIVSATTTVAAGHVQQDKAAAAQSVQQRLFPTLSSFHSLQELFWSCQVHVQSMVQVWECMHPLYHVDDW